MRKIAMLVANDTFPEDASIPPLRFTQNDAEGLKEVLGDLETCGFETKIYLNETSQRILIGLERISGELAHDDTLLFYYSGHGRLRGNELCLVSKDTATSSLAATSIPARQILTYLQESRATRRLLILDCCHSGAIGRLYKGGDTDSALASLAHGFGSYILTASTAIQLAEERERDGHGVFTKALIDCLREGRKERITVDDWYEYAYARLKVLANQTPVKWGLQLEGPSFEIGSFKARLEQRRQQERERLERERQREKEELLLKARTKLGVLVAAGVLIEEHVESIARLLEGNEARLFPHERMFREDVIRYAKGEANFLDVFGTGYLEPAPKTQSEANPLVAQAEAPVIAPPLPPPGSTVSDRAISPPEPAVFDEPVMPAESLEATVATLAASAAIAPPMHEAPLGLAGDGGVAKVAKLQAASPRVQPISATAALLGGFVALAVMLLGTVGYFYLRPREPNLGVVQPPQPTVTVGSVQHAWLGVHMQNVDDTIAESLNLGQPRGALITVTDDKGPAKAAGLKAGDVIIKFDGVDVKDRHDLQQMIYAEPVGKEVGVVVMRQGEQITKTIELGYGDRYEGELRDGKMNGHGVFTAPDGSKYDGEFRDDKRNGHGVFTASDGSKYDGEYRDGKKNGHGVLTFANGDPYVGAFLDGKYSGRGVYIGKDGHRYDGEYRDDKRNGHGVFTAPDGTRYDGEWRDGKRNGHGVLTNANGSRYDGEWRDDRLIEQNSAKESEQSKNTAERIARGNAYYDKKDYHRAIADYNEAIRLDPKDGYINNRNNAYKAAASPRRK